MGIFDFIRRGASAEAVSRPRAEAPGGITFTGLDDPALLETEGNAYARVIRAAGRPLHLIPFEKGCVDPKLGGNYRMQYRCQTEKGGHITLDQDEILHVRDLSLDGVEGLSRRKLSTEVFELARGAQRRESSRRALWLSDR
ncbi:phage portal protein [Paenacidovorax monticola]|uniref:Phage portal protein n=1 Tax=Paenacidovorax monticola TaxID=1926868 RepID=A0A7H0HLP6_9BURK|nr:phage portal protein [Paenacidovorax monticola]QNP61462.1 hypothetical protein H9L24_06800 [Paenacidovorax monticola]